MRDSEIIPKDPLSITRNAGIATERLKTLSTVNLIFSLAVAILVAVAWFAYRNTTSMIKAEQWEKHTQVVVLELEQVLSTLKDAETGQRGFVITANDKYLEPYLAAVSRVGEELTSLKELVKDNPAQEKRVKDLEAPISEKLSELRQTIALRREKGFQAALGRVEENFGKGQMDEIRRRVAELQAEEERLLQERAKTTAADSRAVFLTGCVGGVLGFALLWLAFSLLRKEIAQRLQAQDELTSYRDQLEELVKARTADLENEVTERKRIAEALVKAKGELEQHNEELEYRVTERTAKLQQAVVEMEHFSYVASHDLQEPLRTVGSFSQLLARRYQGKLDADADEFIGFIVDAAKRMQTLINDLLALSRVGTRGTPFAPIDCNEVVQTAMKNLDMAIAETGAVITGDGLPVLMGDQTQLIQLFQNLFSNAIKFRRPEETPLIHVTAARQAGAWQVSVSDNGIGIDPQFFDRIFIVFQRLHEREKYAGTGIGLAICKKVVERHGGRMWVESQPGSGTTFHFTIPDERKKL